MRNTRPVTVGLKACLTIAAASVLGFMGGGCTVVPVEQFTAYREGFAEARRTGEEVLLSYAAARDTVLAPASAEPMRPVRENALPARAEASAAIDEVEEFMAGWDAVERYNDFLAAIIEGREASEIEAIYGGFQAVVASLPARTAAAIGRATGPWGAVIDIAVQSLDQEMRKRRFIGKLKEGGAIVQAILRLHADSAPLMYDAQFLANEAKFVPVANRFRRRLADARKLLREKEFADEADIVAAINRQQDVFAATGAEPIEPSEVAGSSTPAGPPAERDLGVIREDLKALYARGLSLTADLNAQKIVLLRYRELVDATEARLLETVQAAAKGETSVPPISEIRRAVIEVRKALAARNERRWADELAR